MKTELDTGRLRVFYSQGPETVLYKNLPLPLSCIVSVRYMMVLCIACQLFVVIFGFLAWKTYTPGVLQPSCNSSTVTETSTMSNHHLGAISETMATLDDHATGNGSCTGEDNMAFNAAILKQTTV